MKTLTGHSVRPIVGAALAAATLVMAAAVTARAATHTWTGAASGNWSDSANWDANGVPPSDGSADVVFAIGSANVTATVDATWAADGAVNKITVNAAAGTLTLAKGAGVTRLRLGAGGLARPNASGGNLSLDIPLHLTASQSWALLDSNGGRHTYLRTDLSSPEGVVLTVAGGDELRIESGSSANFLGSVVVNGVVLPMTASMDGRLGTNVTLYAKDDLVPGVSSYCSLVPYDTSAGYRPLPYALTVIATNANRTASIRSGYAYGTGVTLDLTNRVSGVCVGGSDSGGAFYFQTGSALWDDRIRFVLSGDNSGLTGQTNVVTGATIVLRNGQLIANHANALGANNTLAVQIGQINSADAGSYSGLLATNGLTLSANITVKNNQNAAPQPALADLGLTGSGSATFTRDIAVYGAGAAGSAMAPPMVRLTAGAGGTARFTGKFYDRWNDPKNGPIIVCGLGDVVLAGANTWNNNGDGSVSQGRMTIRSGRLLVENSAALGKTNLAVKVGDTVRRVANVRVATQIGVPNVSAWSAGTYTFSAVPTIDGVQPALGDRVLVKDEVYDGQRHGVYEVTAADKKTWTRASDMDEASEFAYGTRVVATNGTFNAGRSFYLVNKQDVYGAAFTVNTTRVGFNPEPAAEPDVALLTAASVTVPNPVEVLANYSAGKVTLGGASAHASAFSNAVSLARDVELTAFTNGAVTFAGAISGTGGVTKVGAGVVKLANAGNSYTGGTGIRVTAGELAAGARLEVAGTLDLSGANDTLAVSGTLDRNTTYTLASYGTLNGTFDTVTGLVKHTVRYDGPGNTIQLKPFPRGLMISVR